MPEGPGDLCLRWKILFLSSWVVMAGKVRSRILILECGNGLR